ncbi:MULTISPECIES: RAQPRD family integrative conjugative element protein [Thauera]|uniref:RAQPRD family integrative conjugative element protein n=1 Tax=Thauera sinica TaxID=2665146 RepID=A0ABW1AXU4_9RHOO|nr:RAQPRD family integrative conjugative element protein [Thauera sp. K11]ATE62403.1 raqprd family integrative conjugative element protein [Thauera sp. K11]
MFQISCHACGQRHWMALLVVALSVWQPATAADAIEREQLAALVRQLDLIERLTEHAASIAPQQRARYYFDYARLHEDVQRVRSGIRDYLTPARAQPRDPAVLLGDYRQPVTPVAAPEDAP